MYEPDQPDAEEALSRAHKAEQEKWDEALCFVMSDQRGRRFVWRLLEEAGIYRTVYNEAHASMALLEGKRQIGLLLVEETHRLCQDEYVRMTREQKKHG